jgi:hypothetical protein
MKRSDLIGLENTIMAEVVKRRKLGGYNPDAEGILLIAEILMRLLQHIVDEMPAVDTSEVKPLKEGRRRH